MLGLPNNRDDEVDDEVTVREVLVDLADRVRGRLAPEPAGPASPGQPGGGGAAVADLVADDRLFPALTRVAGPRFGSDDAALVGAQLVREWVATVTAAAVTTWGRQRRLFDWSPHNVVVRADGTVALRRPRLLVAADDPLAAAPGVTVAPEHALLHTLLDGVLGTDPGSGPVAAIVAAARRAVRSGDRHYWGTAALTVANTLTAVSHEVGPRADRDRELILARRPDLARTVEVLTVDDGRGGTVSCARRLTCCLLVKLPGEVQCGTCNLRDPDRCRAALAAWARAERARHRAAAACAS
ncbi:MAG TPA: hypothetical protein VIL48_14975 [Acidimicrobiales bacterium]